MNKIFLILTGGIILLSFFSCQMNAEQANSKLALAWMEALNKHDTVRLAGFYADSATLESPNWVGIKKGPEEARTTYRRYFSSTPDLEQKITHLISTDSCLVIEYDSWGTLTNPEAMTPEYMQGKKYRLHNCTRLSLTNGKIMVQKTYFDQVSFLMQMGFFDEH